MIRLVLLAILALVSTKVLAHETWANGDPIPEWVKKACCNGHEAHDLGEGGDMVHVVLKDGEIVAYTVDGFNNRIEAKKVHPSEDNHTWVFYGGSGYEDDHHHVAPPPPGDVSNFSLYCLFVPCAPKNKDDPENFGASCS